MKILTFLLFSLSFLVSFGQDFIQCQNEKLSLKNTPFETKSIFFENDSRFLQNHFLYTKADYVTVKNLGFNTIQLEMIARSFGEKQYKRQLEWLSEQITWAKEQQLFIILSLYHEKYEEKELAIWQKIATHFANEPNILAFNLWQKSSTIHDNWIPEIRKIDTHHILMIEQSQVPFVKVNDANILYSFFFDEPFSFSNQAKKWDNLKNNQKYPDNTKLEFPKDLSTAYADTSNSKFRTGKSEWTYYEGKYFHIPDSILQDIVVASPILSSSKSPVGSIFFGEFVVEEIDSVGKTTEILRIHPYNSPNWEWNSQDGNGSFKQIRSQDIDNNDVLVILRTEELGYCSNRELRFIPKKGHFYKVSGWVKGDDVSFEAENCFGLLIEKSINNIPIFHRNTDFLQFHLNYFLQFQQENKVPISIQLGLKNNTFKQKRGGEIWMNDVLKIIENNGFCYYNYLSDDFGIYSTTKKGKKGNKLIIEYLKNN